jgi:hypothetical protein
MLVAVGPETWRRPVENLSQNKVLTSGDGSYSAFNTGLSTPRQDTIYGLFRENQNPGHQQWRLHGWYVESDRVLRDNFPALPDLPYLHRQPGWSPLPWSS